LKETSKFISDHKYTPQKRKTVAEMLEVYSVEREQRNSERKSNIKER
jgi:hypothetical protein